jgi:hypothetical protein
MHVICAYSTRAAHSGSHLLTLLLRRFREVTHRCSREVTHLLGNQELN